MVNSKLNVVKLGSLITSCDIRNKDFNICNVKGISVKKEFREPTSKVNRKKLSNYKLVKPNQFAFVKTTNNEKVFAFAYNNTNQDIVVSSVNEVFYISSPDLLPEYLKIFLSRKEFDRYARYYSWGTARETFNWDDLCNVELKLPPVEIQQKYVDIYNGLLNQQHSFENSLEDLKLSILSFTDKIKHGYEYKSISNFIEECKNLNTNLQVKDFSGLNVDMKFIPAKRIADNKEKTKIVKTGEFAFNKVVKCGGTRLPIALRQDNDCAISSSYVVFKIKDNNLLLNEYLIIWLLRSETHRLLGFNSWGTTRDTISLKELGELKIPFIPMNLQESLSNLYNVYIVRQRISEKLKLQIKDICPILIAGAIKEASTLKN